MFNPWFFLRINALLETDAVTVDTITALAVKHNLVAQWENYRKRYTWNPPYTNYWKNKLIGNNIERINRGRKNSANQLSWGGPANWCAKIPKNGIPDAKT
jgi:hypothetical protein